MKEFETTGMDATEISIRAYIEITQASRKIIGLRSFEIITGKDCGEAIETIENNFDLVSEGFVRRYLKVSYSGFVDANEKFLASLRKAKKELEELK